jgi:transcriptional regulator with XRE-family HTH domain
LSSSVRTTPSRLAGALKLTRQFHRLSQTEVAERLGISKSHLSELEAGKKSPSIELLQRYAKVFDLPPSTFLLFAERLEGKMPRRQQTKVDRLLAFLDWVVKDDSVARGLKGKNSS